MHSSSPAAPLPAATPIRRCVGCRRPAAKPTLVRMVVSEGTPVVDPDARLPGRGAYVCHRRPCLDRVLQRSGRALARALRADPACVTVDGQALTSAWQIAVADRQATGPSSGAAATIDQNGRTSRAGREQRGRSLAAGRKGACT